MPKSEIKAEIIMKSKDDNNKLSDKEQRARDALSQQQSMLESYLSEEALKRSDESVLSGLMTHNLNGIYGLPYQFMTNVDPILTGTQFGRKYSERIISKMPLLLMTPGKVRFMSNFSKEEKKGILADLLQVGKGLNVETDIDSIIKDNGKFFTFEFAYTEYFDYVNAICRTGARYLGIQDVTMDIGGKQATADKFNWQDALNSNFKATFTSQEFIAFYMDSSDQVSEEFSNETTQSQLASTVNGMSDLGREIGFLLGAGAGTTFEWMDQAKLDSTMQTIEELTNKYLNGSNIIKNIANNFATVACGGKLLFPEIWADSSFSRSFDITIKLRTPDASIMAWYTNILVPLAHLIGFTAGHTETAATASAQSYFSPFLIRAFYKGLFNIEMGIITSMSITKGKESAWTINGLPTEVNVTLSIKDLYNMMAITPGAKPKYFVSNSILMDYIANTCGVNINKMDIQRTLEIYLILSSNRLTDIPNKIHSNIQTGIDNMAMRVYDAAINKLLPNL